MFTKSEWRGLLYGQLKEKVTKRFGRMSMLSKTIFVSLKILEVWRQSLEHQHLGVYYSLTYVPYMYIYICHIPNVTVVGDRAFKEVIRVK